MTLAARLIFRCTAAGLSLSAMLSARPLAAQEIELPPKKGPNQPVKEREPDKGTTLPGTPDPKSPTAEKPPEKPILLIVEEALRSPSRGRLTAALSLLNEARFESESSGAAVEAGRMDAERRQLTAIETQVRKILTGERISADAELQAAALKSLGRVATETDLGQLKAIFKAGLESPTPAVRKAAVQGLINLQFQGGENLAKVYNKAQAETFPLVAPLVNDPVDDVSDSAAEFLDNLVNLEKLRVLIRDVTKDLNDSSTTRADLMRDIDERQRPESLKEQSVGLNVGGDIVTPLAAAVRSGNVPRQRKALLLLRDYTLSRRMLRNVRSFDVKTFRFDESAVSALPAELDPLADKLLAVQPVLATALRSNDEPVRRMAAEVFENLSPAASGQLPAILASLDDRSRIVRWISARTLGLYAGRDGGSPDAIVSRLAGALADEEVEVRVAAAVSLRRFGPAAKPAIPALLQAMNVGDSAGRSAAMLALVATREAPSVLVPALVANLDSPLVGLREGAVRALGALGPPARDALPRLKKLLTDEDASIRIEAARAILAIDADPDKK